ncbi:adenosine deaminase family protein [Spirochaeta africana]|uniref:adenosine deaminase n=1 Tax=Spirochaeta africana (strain ATCC 700263 / DSM 8902 / Z-7692) TaxID=889378 RepID=H9UIC2_SPIAZ|nr:adenosine deaminase family protein [Spirochaeta africana]AFG37265.1 adenosine deaminase [Spirochaeta africana DSM 8902]
MSHRDPAFLKAIPKTDLHVHLDGSLRIPTLIELAETAGVELPARDEAGLRRLVFKDSYASLEEYLQGFALTTAVMQTREALHRISYELMMDNAAEGVRYIEVRFAPQLLISDRLSFRQVMQAVDDGLRQARDELNAGCGEDEPPYEYGIIACAMRFFTRDFSPYYRDFWQVHQFSTPKEIIRMAGVELAKAVNRLRRETDIQVVAFDLAGAEYGYPAADHAEAYGLVHKGFLCKTVHAGEAFGPESIFQAVTELHADRIGHGLHLFDPDMITSPDIEDPQRYVEDLVNYLADRRITIEVCLTSNMQTTPAMRDLRNHSLARMLDHNLSVSFCTDNRLVSNTTVTNELQLALDTFDFDAHTLRNCIVYGFKRSFFYHPYTEKRRYVRSVIDYYQRIAARYGVKEQV